MDTSPLPSSDLSAPSGWTPIDAFPQRSFVSGDPEVERVEGRKVHVAARIVEPDGAVVTAGAAILVGLALDTLNALCNAPDA